MELHLRNSDGTEKFVICNGRPILDKYGKKAGSVLVLHDRTSQRLAEVQKIHLESEKRHLKKINAELERFSSIAAHDLKSPLNSITQYAEVLKEDFSDKLDSQGIEFLQTIIKAGQRLRSLIDDLLYYAQSGHEQSAMTVVDTDALVKEVLTFMRADLHASEASLEVGPLPNVYADKRGVTQIFQNLILNAIKYAGDKKPVIRISAVEQNFHWRFEIKDNGMGFSAKAQKSAFDEFTRFHGAKAPEGTGLGLPICKRIVESHGGAIWLKSEEGQGTTVYFTLPKASTPPGQIH
jgi:light-regulated signal transduction histidine kinase (bacteriophytochrome)